VKFVVDKVALEQDFLLVLQFSPVNIIPPWLSILKYHVGMNNRPAGDLTVAQIVIKLSAFYGTRRLIAVFTEVHHQLMSESDVSNPPSLGLYQIFSRSI
jgi:hypothetical protein